jgi:hypothetical protein
MREGWYGIGRFETRIGIEVRESEQERGSPKRGSLGGAHDSKPENCASQDESVDHLRLKKIIAGLIRSSGFEAVVEAGPSASDVGGWRADVLGVGVDGRRVAFEVQLAGMTIAEGQERTGAMTWTASQPCGSRRGTRDGWRRCPAPTYK